MDASAKRSVLGGLFFPVLIGGGMIAAFHASAVPESTKFLLAGITLLAEALWARRYFKRV